MIEAHITLQANGISIAGTVCLPSANNQYPMVLFVHGSGPLDRNENAKGSKLNIFNTTAHHLAKNGIGSFRYDKRGCGKSSGNYHEATHKDLVKDAHSLVTYLANLDCSDSEKIYVLGHSEGSIIAPQLASTHPNVAGIILLCPFAQPMEDILRAQAQQIQRDLGNISGIKGKLLRCAVRLLGDPITTQNRLIEKLKTSSTPIIRYKFKTLNAAWFRELFALDTDTTYRNIPCSMLIIAGGKDIQCAPEDVEHIKCLVGQPIEAHILPNLTHILRNDPQEPSFFHYRKLLKQEIEEEILVLIQRWLSSH